MNRIMLSAILCAIAALCSISAAHAANSDVNGLVPTIWWDFETQPNAKGLASTNKGSKSITFTGEGTATYQSGVTNGWAIDTTKYTPYSNAGTYSTDGYPITVSLVMTLGSNPNGITLNVRTTAGDLIIRRGATEGSLVVAWGAQKAASSQFLNATFADGDAAWHLVSVVGSSAGTALYVDGQLADSSTAFSPWSASGKVTQMQFGSHLNGIKGDEARLGGLIDDLRIHDAALSAAQIKAIAAEYGLALLPDALDVSGDPQDWGTVIPDYGTTSGLSQGDTISCSATGSETESTKIIPTGYSLYSVASDGGETLVEKSDATSFTYTHGSDAGRLVWHWAQSNMVTVASGSNGSVSEGGWAGYGEPFSLTAAPDSGYKFGYWTGDVAGIDILSASTVIPSVTAPVSLAAEFVKAGADVTVQYVSPTGSDDNDGYFESSPKKTIAAALAALDLIASVAGRACTVHVAEGRYSISKPIVITNAISIIGNDLEPSSVIVSNTQGVAWGNKNQRCLFVNNPDVRVSGMTFENGRDYGDGGNVRIDANGGMVTNCILRGGYTREDNDSAGANVAITGPGLVTHCKIFGGWQNNCQGCTKMSSVYLNAAGARIENCLIDGFKGSDVSSQPTKNSCGIYVEKGVAVNCTVLNCKSPYTDASGVAGILIASDNGQVLNSVSVANVDSNGTVRAFMASQISRTSHCAFDAIDGETTIPEGMPNAVVGTAAEFFKDYANGDYTLNPTSRLVNAGANYEGMASVDLAGNPRKVGSRIDIGCYELRSTPLKIIVR